MAKLSAHGTELLRYSKILNVPDMTDDVEWYRKHYAIFSDGRMLTKLVTRLKDSQFRKAHNHSYGWKLEKGRVKKDLDLKAHKAKLVEAGYEIELDNLPA